MKLRKLMAGFVSAAMVMGTVALPAFADETPLIENTVEEVTENFETEPEEETNVVATYNGKNYSTLEEATAAAKADKDPSRPVPRITLLTDNVDITEGQNYPVRYTMTAKNTTLSGDREWIKTYSNKMEIDVASSVSTITLDNMMGLYNLVLEKGADVTLYECADFRPALVGEYDAIAFGCPAMGDEVLEEDEFEPMFDGCKDALKDKKIALFGSYGWGDGEWMRNWEESCKEAGAVLATESVICNDMPDDDGVANCKELGAALA